MSLSMRWQLDDLYSSFDDKKFTDDLAGLKTAINDLTRYAETAFSDSTDAVGKLEKYIGMENELNRFQTLSYYCELVMSVDALDARATKFGDVIETLFTGLAKPDVLFKQFIAGLPDLESVISESPVLKEHAFILRELKAAAAFSLSEKEEIVIATMSTTGSSAWGTMKEQLFATLSAEITLGGFAQTLPMTAIRNLAYHNDPEARKNAYFAELSAYEKTEQATAAALNAIKGEVISLSKLRGYASPLDMTLIDSRMARKTLDAMFAAMQDAFPAFQKYFRKKADLLGHKNGLPFYDLFAPVGKAEANYTYDEAYELIVRIFSGFSENLGAFAKKAFENRWIDAEIREGKRGGAFCENLLAIGQSRIMANYSGTFNDVLTLAHELGHAYHGECLKNETPINSDYTMPIAETASTFCETLVCDAMMKTVPAAEKLSILENDLSGAAQVIVDIYSRFLFEDAVFAQRENGPLSVGEFKELMLGAQRKAYGGGLDPAFLHPYMWVCKPHYYYADSNYYNFPYAYGQLFSKGLYAAYLREGAPFIKKYDALLAAAGKNSLEDLARLVGIDVTQKSFWAGSLKLYEDMIDEFCGY